MDLSVLLFFETLNLPLKTFYEKYLVPLNIPINDFHFLHDILTKKSDRMIFYEEFKSYFETNEQNAFNNNNHNFNSEDRTICFRSVIDNYVFLIILLTLIIYIILEFIHSGGKLESLLLGTANQFHDIYMQIFLDIKLYFIRSIKIIQ